MSSNQLVSVNQELGYFTTWRCGEEMVVMQLYAVNARPCVRVCVCVLHCCAPEWEAVSWCSSCWSFGLVSRLPCQGHPVLAEEWTTAKKPDNKKSTRIQNDMETNSCQHLQAYTGCCSNVKCTNIKSTQKTDMQEGTIERMRIGKLITDDPLLMFPFTKLLALPQKRIYN